MIVEKRQVFFSFLSTFCAQQGSCSPGAIALLLIAPASCRRLSQTLLTKRVFMMTGAWTSSQTMPMSRVWCSAALRWHKWASMRTRLWRSTETLTSSPQPSRELCMESTSCVMGFNDLAKPVRLTQHMFCLQTCHHLCTMVLHGSAAAGHAFVDGGVRWLLGLIQYWFACMWCISE